MLTAEGCRARRERLWTSLEDPQDLILIGDAAHQMYFANYWADPFVFRSANAASVLILPRDRPSTLVADSMVHAYAERAHVDVVSVPVWYDGKHTAPARGPLLVENVLKVVEELAGKRIGVESACLPAGILEGLQHARGDLDIVSVDQAIHRMKRQKDSDELELLRRSISAMEAGFAAARAKIHAGMNELDAFHIVEQASRDALGMQVPVYGDFVSGPNTQKGGAPSLRKIEPGDLFLLDYSVIVYGYRGDFAATWVVDAEPTAEERRLHAACIAAIQAGEALLRPGTPCRQIDRAVRDAFAARNLEANFTSHSGHGLGLGHPDPPYIVADSGDVLLEGDVVTLEPSQKIPGLGTIRIEHNYRITAAGFERLSKHSLAIDAKG